MRKGRITSCMRKKLIACDFDGTVSPKDMGYRVLKHFATDDGWELISKSYETGRIGSQEAYRTAAPLYRVTKEEMIRYVESQGTIDHFFPDFYRFCTVEKNYDIVIISDGLDFYIETMLKKYALHDIRYYANKLCFSEDGTLSIEFPYKDMECNRCGNCKRSLLRSFRRNYDEIIYIGDGYSDICPAQDADLVFAKDVLYTNLVKKGKQCLRYKDFNDINHYFGGNYGNIDLD